MPYYVHRTTFAELPSTSTPDLPEPEANYVKDPSPWPFTNEPKRYWSLTGDVFSVVDQAAQDVIDADIAAASVESEKTRQKDSYSDNDIFRAQIKYVVDEVNIIRANAGLTPARTYGGAQTYMFDAIDNEEV